MLYWCCSLRVFIGPLGFHEDFLLRALVKYRVQVGDVVLIITCEPVVGGVKSAYESLVSLSTRQGFPQPRLISLNCNDFYSSMRALKRVLGEYSEGDLYFCAGGGLRSLTILILTTLVSIRKPFTIHYEPEAGEGFFAVKPELFYNIMNKPSAVEEETVKIALSRPGISIKELARELGVKEKTARNIVSRLKKRGLIYKKGKREGIEPSEIALALYG